MIYIGSFAFAEVPLQTLVVGSGLSGKSAVQYEAFLNVCKTLRSVSIDSPGALGRGSSYNGYLPYYRDDNNHLYITQLYEGLYFGTQRDFQWDSYSNGSAIGSAISTYACPVLETIILGDNVETVGDYLSLIHI